MSDPGPWLVSSPWSVSKRTLVEELGIPVPPTDEIGCFSPRDWKLFTSLAGISVA